jgi:hypothetical protein
MKTSTEIAEMIRRVRKDGELLVATRAEALNLQDCAEDVCYSFGVRRVATGYLVTDLDD